MRNFDLKRALGGGNGENQSGDKVLDKLCNSSSPQRGEEAILSEQKRTLRVQVRGLKSTNPPHSSLKKGGSNSRHTEEQHLQSAECWLKTQAVCKTFQPNEDTFNANVVIGNEESHNRGDFTNTAILRGLNNYPPQNDCKLAESATHVAHSNNSRKVAFTEPSRGMSGAKVEQTSAETLSFRCVCERCRLTRGDVSSKRRKAAFTLAEVLITLGIIGVIAALTLPSLISKYQKHVYYNQFLKAVSVLGNAEKLYINDYCGGDATNCSFGVDNQENPNPNFYNEFSQYFKIIKKINLKNYEEVCNGYTKLPVSERLDGSQREENACSLYWYGVDKEKDYGFITADGMMLNLAVYEGPSEGGFVDINGPDKGPNIVGRDIFHFIYQNGNRDRSQVEGIFWNTETYMKNFVSGGGDNYYSCAAKYNTWANAWTCGERLLRDGKMDY